jgi:hypothetical protein
MFAGVSTPVWAQSPVGALPLSAAERPLSTFARVAGDADAPAGSDGVEPGLQPRRPPPPARRGGMTFGVRASFIVEAERMSARQTFTAEFSSPQVIGYGGGADVVIDRRFFARLSFSRLSKKGTRGFVDAGQFFSTGVPIQVVMEPVEIGGGLRLAGGVRRRVLTPYVGASLVLLRFRQISPDAGPTDDLPETFHGAEVFGGVDVLVARRVSIGAEAAYRTLPHAIGTSDVSQSFGESNLGGIVVRVMGSLRFGRF